MTTWYHFSDFVFGQALVGSVDYVTNPGSVVPVKMWTAQTGGTQITTLLDVNNNPVTQITPSANGQAQWAAQVPEVWADAGAGRVLIAAYDYVAASTDAAVAPLVPPGSGSATGAALAATYAPISEPVAGTKLAQSANLSDLANAQTARGNLGISASALGLFNVKIDFGAKGDGSTDDTTAITNAITAAASVGGIVFFPAGTYITTTQNIPSNVTLQGSAIGATTIKLKNGTNADLLTVANFGTLTGTNGNGGPSKFALRAMTLDGNMANNTSGWVMRIFAFNYTVDSVEFLHGASGGVWTEWGTGGSDMESRWSNFKIGNNGTATDFEVRGPHDSQYVNGVVFRDSSNTPANTGIGINIAGNGGGQFTNVHAWGSRAQQWVIKGGQLLTNCVSDGPGGITILSDLVTWIGGAIYSDNGATPGDVGITFGDGTTRTIRSCLINTVMFNYGTNQMMTRVRTNTTMTANRFIVNGNLGNCQGVYAAGEGASTTASALSNPWTSIPLKTGDGAKFPTSGNVTVSDGTNLVRVGYTGVSGDTLTGVASQTTAIASGAAVFLWSTQNADWWDVSNPFDTGNRGKFATALQTNQKRTWNDAEHDFFSPILMQNFPVQGKNGGGTTTWKANADGSIQPGGSAGTGARIWSGSGAPSSPAGSIAYNLGDAYLRTDTPGTANQRLYLCTTAGTGGSAVWTGVL